MIGLFIDHDTEWTNDAQVEQYISENTASTAASVYDAGIEEAKIRIAKLEKDYKRFSELQKKNAATPIQVEQYKTELDAARMKLEQLQRQKAASKSQVTEVTQRKTNAEATILRAEAGVDMARLNLSYTVVTAPNDGWQGRRTIEGQLVSPGVTLTTIIPTDNASGNFVKIQQRVPVRIDLENLTEEDNHRMAAGMMCEVKVKVNGDK